MIRLIGLAVGALVALLLAALYLAFLTGAIFGILVFIFEKEGS